MNAIPVREVLVPGQGIAIGVFAEGDQRDALLAGTTFRFRIRSGEATTVVPARKPDASKAVKAEGADYVQHVLGAAGIAEAVNQRVKGLLTRVSVAVVLPDWKAPEVTARQDVVVEGDALLPTGETVKLSPSHVVVETWASAAALPWPADKRIQQRWMESYALRPEPQYLAEILRRGAASGGHPLVVLGFPSYAIEAAPAGVVPFLIAALRDDTERTRYVGALALRWAGKDASPLVATLSEEMRARVAAFPNRPDAYALDLKPEALDPTTQKVDLLWGEFMATGRAAPIRAIVDLLRLRDDYPTLAEAMKTPGLKKDLTPELARGATYATAGWSLVSFVKSSSGVAADYVARWKEDPAIPAVIREELRKLLTNEAFRRQQPPEP